MEHAPDDPTLKAAKAVALNRLYKCEEAAGIYEQLLTSFSETDEASTIPKRWRISTYDQAARCYKRWAEIDFENRDYEKSKVHINRSLEILGLASQVNDFDSFMCKTAGKSLCDAIYLAIRLDDEIYATEVMMATRTWGFTPQMPRTPRVSNTLKNMRDRWPHLSKLEGARLEDEFFRIDSTHSIDDLGSKGFTMGEKLRGKILNLSQSFGFIAVSNRRNVHFRKNELVDRRQWSSIEEGTDVSFEIGTYDSGISGVRVEIVSPKGVLLLDEEYARALGNAISDNRKALIAIIWAQINNDRFDRKLDAPALIEGLSGFVDIDKLSDRVKTTFEAATKGIAEKIDQIDNLIGEKSTSPLDRIEITVRNVLRVGVFVLRFGSEYGIRFQAVYAINEAVEITKNLMDKKASGFVNGVLNALMPPVQRQAGGLVFKSDGATHFALVKEAFGRKRWTLSKGSIKDGEEFHDGFMRIIEREIGIEIEVIRKIGETSFTSFSSSDGPIQKNVTYFLGRTKDKILRLEKKDGLSHAKWFSAEAVRQLPFHQDLKSIILPTVDEVIKEYPERRIFSTWRWLQKLLRN